MQLKVKVDNEWVEIPATTEIADDIISDKLTYSSKKIEELIADNNSGHNYSTDEQVVGTWIDGKPVYEKVIVLTPNGDYFPKGADGTYNIDDLSMDNLVSINSILHRADGYFEPSGEHAWSGGYSWAIHTITSTSVMVWIGGSPNIDRATIIIRYTKTTDAIPRAVTE